MKVANSLLVLLLILLPLFFHTRGFVPHDEGWVLNAASRILEGEIPYRDFYFLYTPGSIFSVAAFYKIFGESILAARIPAFLFSILSVFFLYKILKQVTNHKLLVISSVLLFLVWGPFQINFVWMVMLSIASGLATIYFFQKSTQNSNYAYLAGISAALTLLFKQNFGIAIILVSIIDFIFNSKLRIKTKLLNFIFGFIFVTGLFVIYLLVNNSFFIFIKEMYYLLFQKVILQGMLSSPFIYPDELYKQILKLVFYLSPLIISACSTYLSLKYNKKFIFVSAFPLLYYLFSIRPTTDLIHLAPLISISGISLSLIYALTKNKIAKLVIAVIFLAFILLGIYVIVYRGYYRWESPILNHNIFYKHPKINIFVDSKYKEVLDKIEPELKKSKSEYIFVYHFAPVFYFIADKKNPTYYDDLQPSLLTKSVQDKIASQLKEKKVDTILSNSNLRLEDSIITKFIVQNYYPYKTVHDYTIWKLK